jgi:hypothetical protein
LKLTEPTNGEANKKMRNPNIAMKIYVIYHPWYEKYTAFTTEIYKIEGIIGEFSRQTMSEKHQWKWKELTEGVRFTADFDCEDDD